MRAEGRPSAKMAPSSAPAGPGGMATAMGVAAAPPGRLTQQKCQELTGDLGGALAGRGPVTRIAAEQRGEAVVPGRAGPSCGAARDPGGRAAVTNGGLDHPYWSDKAWPGPTRASLARPTPRSRPSPVLMSAAANAGT